jgi:hypothetical protein
MWVSKDRQRDPWEKEDHNYHQGNEQGSQTGERQKEDETSYAAHLKKRKVEKTQLIRRISC